MVCVAMWDNTRQAPLPRLAELNLYANKLEGSIPTDLGRLTKILNSFRLYSNKLTGTVPSLPFKQYNPCCLSTITSSDFMCPLPADASECFCRGDSGVRCV